MEIALHLDFHQKYNLLNIPNFPLDEDMLSIETDAFGNSNIF